jgi:hypothetical protein
LELFLKIRGASCKYVGCGLILEKMRGLSAKCWEMGFLRNYFVEEKPVDQVHGSVDHHWLGPPWTVRGWVARARRSLASGRSGAQGRPPRGRGWGDRVGEPVKGLTRGRAVARCAGERLAQAKREAKEGVRRGGAVRGCSRCPL